MHMNKSWSLFSVLFQCCCCSQLKQLHLKQTHLNTHLFESSAVCPPLFKNVPSCPVRKISLTDGSMKASESTRSSRWPKMHPDYVKLSEAFTRTASQVCAALLWILCYPSMVLSSLFASRWVSDACRQWCLGYYNLLAVRVFPTSSLGYLYFNNFLILNLSIVSHGLWEPKAALIGALNQVVDMEAKRAKNKNLSGNQIYRSQGWAANKGRERSWNVSYFRSKGNSRAVYPFGRWSKLWKDTCL